MLLEVQAPNMGGETWMGLSEALQAAGRTPEAMEAARTALDFYERKGNEPAMASTRTFIDPTVT
jgi:hypothetical protein